MHEGSQSGLSHGIRICQWSCCGSQREYCSSCCCQYRACSTSPFRQQKFLHSILNSAVPGGVGSNENSTIQWAPADPPCTVCADCVSTRQDCSVQQKAIAEIAVIVLLRGFQNGVSLIRPYSCNTRILPYPAVSCRILSYPAVSCRILPYPAVSCRILPYPAVSCRICRILPYPAFPAVSCRMPVTETLTLTLTLTLTVILIWSFSYW